MNATDTIWLLLENYRALPLNPRLGEHAPELERAIQQGICARPDPRRRDFYDVELDSGWAYIHVRDSARTVYLVAHFRFQFSEFAVAGGQKWGRSPITPILCSTKK